MSQKQDTVLVEKTGLTRESIMLFADAIFGIAITLLVLDIRLPSLSNSHDSAAFIAALQDTFPQVFAFFLSFFVVALFWIGFHRLMQYLRRFDMTMLWLTMGFLFLMAFMAFPTAIIGNYGSAVAPTISYQVTISIASILTFLMWKYASDGDRLIDESMDRRLVQLNKARTLMPGFVLLATIPLTFYNPILAEISWLAMVPLTSMAKRLYGVQDAQYIE